MESPCECGIEPPGPQAMELISYFKINNSVAYWRLSRRGKEIIQVHDTLTVSSITNFAFDYESGHYKDLMEKNYKHVIT